MAKKNDLVALAKGNSGKPVVAAKKPVVKAVEKPKTPEEERDLKAKARVEELLEGVELTPKKEELFEIVDETPKEGQEWLEEQVSSLSESSEALRAELVVAKEDYRRIFEENQRIKNGAGIQDDGIIRTNTIKLFMELQDALVAMGNNPQTGAPNLIIHPVAFLNKLLIFFPYLEQYRKF